MVPADAGDLEGAGALAREPSRRAPPRTPAERRRRPAGVWMLQYIAAVTGINVTFGIPKFPGSLYGSSAPPNARELYALNTLGFDCVANEVSILATRVDSFRFTIPVQQFSFQVIGPRPYLPSESLASKLCAAAAARPPAQPLTSTRASESAPGGVQVAVDEAVQPGPLGGAHRQRRVHGDRDVHSGERRVAQPALRRRLNHVARRPQHLLERSWGGSEGDVRAGERGGARVHGREELYDPGASEEAIARSRGRLRLVRRLARSRGGRC